MGRAGQPSIWDRPMAAERGKDAAEYPILRAEQDHREQEGVDRPVGKGNGADIIEQRQPDQEHGPLGKRQADWTGWATVAAGRSGRRSAWKRENYRDA